MSNIISSDLYRVRKGAAVRNTFIGAALFVVVLLVTILTASSMELAEGAQNVTNMTPAEIAEMQEDAAAAQEIMGPAATGTDLADITLGQSVLIYFFLPIAIAVFCADFSTGTYRNTLSYESSRTKVYLSRLLLSVILCFALVLATVFFSWIVGGIALGFGGFTMAYFVKIFTTILLQTPLLIATVAVCHFLIALTKKSSSTISIFLVGAIGLSIFLQIFAGLFPKYEWMIMLDPQTGGKIMAQSELAPIGQILFIGGYNVFVALAATVAGILHYRKADMP